MEYVAVAMAGISGIQSIQMGQAKGKLYQMKARQATLQAKSDMLKNRAETLNHKKQGIEILENVVRGMAAINARAAAGGIDAFSGSVANYAETQTKKGTVDFFASTENQQLLQAQGQIIEAVGAAQAAQYTGAATLAKRQGWINGMQSFMKAGQMGQSSGMFGGSGGGGGSYLTNADDVPGAGGGY